MWKFALNAATLGFLWKKGKAKIVATLVALVAVVFVHMLCADLVEYFAAAAPEKVLFVVVAKWFLVAVVLAVAVKFWLKKPLSARQELEKLQKETQRVQKEVEKEAKAEAKARVKMADELAKNEVKRVENSAVSQEVLAKKTPLKSRSDVILEKYMRKTES